MSPLPPDFEAQHPEVPSEVNAAANTARRLMFFGGDRPWAITEAAMRHNISPTDIAIALNVKGNHHV